MRTYCSVSVPLPEPPLAPSPTGWRPRSFATSGVMMLCPPVSRMKSKSRPLSRAPTMTSPWISSGTVVSPSSVVSSGGVGAAKAAFVTRFRGSHWSTRTMSLFGDDESLVSMVCGNAIPRMFPLRRR